MSTLITDIIVAANLLRAGQVVAIPTETVYGLAADITNEEAVKKIFTFKSRPSDHPLIIHIASAAELGELCLQIPSYAERLISKYWPGPLTLVLPKSPKVNYIVTGGQETVAVRCPSHPIALKVIKELGQPVAAPSANRFGKLSPTTATHVLEEFDRQEIYVLEGGRCDIGIESTIIDATHPEFFSILRHGIISLEEISETINDKQHQAFSSQRAPGKLESHYAPNKQLYYFSAQQELMEFQQIYSSKLYVISFSDKINPDTPYHFKIKNDPHAVAYQLYFQLRIADKSECEAIAIELPPNVPKWQSIRDRIQKAAYRKLG